MMDASNRNLIGYADEKSGLSVVPRLCSNAYDPAHWYCYHYAGRVTAGTELPINETLCRACSKVVETVEEFPSWMRKDDDE